MSTTRERREARAARLRESADKREASGNAALEHSRQMMDAIPFGQPILVGHHSEGRDRRYRDRAWNTMDRGVEDTRKATSMRSRADNIEAAADRAIYDDDHDVVERLENRIAELEAERDRIKAYNASARKAARKGGEADVSLLDERQQRDLAVTLKYHPRNQADRTFPSYHLSNLAGNIRRYKQRLAVHQSGAARRTREVVNRYAGTCDAVLVEAEGTRRCGVRVEAGDGVARKEHGGDWEVFCDEHR